MKKIFLITIVMISVTLLEAKNNGPILPTKLIAPEKNEKQTLQKRAFVWIEGQWKIINDKYEWKSGHWEEKRVGYVFVDGKWEKKSKGWAWKEGYWKKINLSKWYSLNT
tara:strand:+ start:301 stop:627 length:327 start_codon:yes stop_codon:yes gene_type:complete